jgi:predicted phage baseplate assembly protein
MPNLFDRRYDDLVEIGRSLLPGIAPAWTDFNAHDPGITLMELLAWVAEAQMYSLARMRTDERIAYAALFGIRGAGNRAASGILWSDPLDPNSPARTFSGSIVLKPGYPIYMLGDNTLVYHLTNNILWIPGTITRLRSMSAGGAARDLTSVNDRGGAVFLPLGDSAGPKDVLSMDFQTRSENGIFPTPRSDATDAYWTVGIRAATLSGDAVPAGSAGALATPTASPLEAYLIDGTTSYPVPIIADTSQGLLSTGVLLLDLSQVTGSPQQFTLELRAPSGLPRPPRLIRLEPNVLPITQKTQIVQEAHEVSGQPGQSISLNIPSLCFESGETPLAVDLSDGTNLVRWSRCDHLAGQGPNDQVYELDDRLGLVTFGNGVNGQVPPLGQTALMTYAVSNGVDGNVARNRKWTVEGIAGTFGINVDPLAGGATAASLIDLRRQARRKKDEDHALISAQDILAAARALPLIEVARAWVPSFPVAAAQTGTVTLVALRARPNGVEPSTPPETPRWLEAIRSQLVPSMPLGTRLRVTGPDYVDFTIEARVQFERGRDPTKLLPAVREALRRRLTLVATLPSDIPRDLGVPLSTRDVTSWIRAVAGVTAVSEVAFVTSAGLATDITVSATGLPRADLQNCQFTTSSAGAASSGSAS